MNELSIVEYYGWKSYRLTKYLRFSSVESVDLMVSSPGAISCRLLYDANRLDRLSCCNSSRVGAGLNTIHKIKEFVMHLCHAFGIFNQ